MIKINDSTFMSIMRLSPIKDVGKFYIPIKDNPTTIMIMLHLLHGSNKVILKKRELNIFHQKNLYT